MKNLHDAYKKHMRKEMNPENFDALQERILQASRMERKSLERTEARRQDHRPFYRHSIFLRTATVCAAILVVSGIVLAAPRLGSPGGGSQPGGENQFILTAYAAEKQIPSQDNTIIRTIRTNLNSTLGGDDNRNLYIEFGVDLSCKGENIESLTYTFDHTDVGFKQYTTLDNSTETQNVASSITVDYAAQVSGNSFTNIQITLPAGWNAGTKDADRFGLVPSDPRWILPMKAAADKLAQAPLAITATFKDGSSQTKKYRIAPVKNYVEVQKALYKEFEHDSSMSPEREKNLEEKYRLFTVSEIP